MGRSVDQDHRSSCPSLNLKLVANGQQQEEDKDEGKEGVEDAKHRHPAWHSRGHVRFEAGRWRVLPDGMRFFIRGFANRGQRGEIIRIIVPVINRGGAIKAGVGAF